MSIKKKIFILKDFNLWFPIFVEQGFSEELPKLEDITLKSSMIKNMYKIQNLILN